MTDEKYTFIQDCKDKKRTARGASHKRTHCGKGGAVMFPSDYLTNKEKKAMNGECKTYHMNDPMSWKEFKYMPQDLQRTYIIGLRDAFGAHNKAIFSMLGISDAAGSKYFAKIGLSLGKGKTPGKFNEETWNRWLKGEEEILFDTPDESDIQDYIDQDISTTERVIKQVTDPDEFAKLTRIVEDVSDLPSSVSYVRVPNYEAHDKVAMPGGRLSFEGGVYDILQRIGTIIGNKNVQMTISWDIKEEQ